MYAFEFKSKLKRLNDRLFIDDSIRTPISPGFYASSLFGPPKRSTKVRDYGQLTGAVRELTEDIDTGNRPQQVCAVPMGWVPEYDQIDITTGKLQARGWRTILLILVKQNFISLDRARTVFECGGLGTDEYDKLDLAGKLRWAKDERHVEDKLCLQTL